MAKAHFHNYHELYYLEKGRTTYFVGNKIYHLEAGDMILIPKGTFHKTSNEENKLLERHLFAFEENVIDPEHLHCLDELIRSQYIKFPREHIHQITEIVRKISKEDKLRQKDYMKMQKLYLQQMLILMSRYRITDTHPNYPEIHHVIQDAVTYISQNINSDLSLNTLSSKYGLSANYFSKQFKTLTGIGLSEYINIARITAAEKLLLTTTKPVMQIAHECGFNDSNYFASVFKKLKGITPKKYALRNS